MKKALFYVMLGIIIALLGLIIYEKFAVNSSIKDVFKEEQTIYQNKIDKKLVVSSLKVKAEIVGLEGDIKKQVGYQDKIYETNFKWLDTLGEREYGIEINGIFKMGFDLNSIKEEHIFIKDEVVKIISPEITLISLELPYDEMKIHEKVGILRNELEEEEKQYIFKVTKEKIKKELLDDEKTLKVAKINTQKAIEEFLSKIPGIKKIEFIEI